MSWFNTGSTATVEPRHAPERRTPGGYAKHRQNAAQRSRDRSASERELSPLPPVADPKRRAMAKKKLRRFIEIYLKGKKKADKLPFWMKWGKPHLAFMDAIERCVIDGEVCVIAMPRGSGKTTIAIAAVLWAILCHGHRFVMLIAANKTAAKGLIQKVTALVKANKKLREDFPEWLVPFQRTKGVNQARPLYHGEPVELKLAKTEIVFGCLPGLCDGAIVKCAGLLGSDIRGQLQGSDEGEFVRPTFFLCDDPQTRASAVSEKQNETRISILANDVLGMAGPGESLGGICSVTVVAKGDMADQILDNEAYPQYHGQRYAMLEGLPPEKECEHLRKYGDARREGLRKRDGGRAANAYWRKHFKTLTKGLKPYWPERKERGELDAIQHAINLWLEDRRKFYAEYQNDPAGADSTDDRKLSSAVLIYRQSGRRKGLVPLGVQHIAAGIDVQGDLLYWTVLATEAVPTGYIIDYGVWPPQPRDYFSLRDASPTIEMFLKKRDGIVRDTEAQIYAALETLFDELAGRQYEFEGSGIMSVGRIVPDANWLPEVVHRACKESSHKNILLPSFGAKPSVFHRDGRSTSVGRFGTDYVIYPPGPKRPMRHVGLNSSAWITRVHNAFMAPKGSQGAWLLYQDDPHHHRNYADNITAETFTDWTDDKTGRKERRWTLLPARDNHWLDSTKLAGIGCFDLGCQPNFRPHELPPPPRKKRDPVVVYHD